ncbi:purine-nucleoside phosphorylase [Corallococcus exiguus]|uniref:Uridine phosphorylase n=1 Tax=Corallococcus exiguus TaxID=83462 RepID=A0A7X5BWB0_9BACT|nr:MULTISPECIES: purine-nucleoside phosphorylase [Corallococcus]MBN8466450.1 purine-nucleoside phosphorylase [Corallococcus exiguus]NBC43112.1 purine-nucleoside phosphorylase [Corallococcus exiguus]NNB88048.1 purine-nucleoside phosphorylase [Corallococcus exiguus]NNB96674.1 purine-nucleoside phosphorylase [Corallococcus exiguus]NNC06443.1 purine-nucleoside phosphorylase [Corallococcus exiguus]
MATPHISASPGDFAEVILMPGDPLRARYISERFLENARSVTSVRNMLGFTGTFRGKRLSVMGHGMGVPSISIYATELVKNYGAKVLIRVGSCGALRTDVKLRDVIVAMGAGTDSNVNRMRVMGHDFPAVADFTLARRAVEAAEKRNKPVRVGNVFTSDLFYHPQEALNATLEKMGILAVEMEIAGLYGVAAEFGARALSLLTVSDHIRTGEHLSPEDRQTTFDEMIELALDVAASEA